MNAAPEARWICEARSPGKAPHHFETFGEDAARAYCDAQGWEFIRAFLEGSHSDRRGKADGSPMISAKQLKSLIVEAQTTYRTLTKRGVDMPEFDDWRKDILIQIVKRDSFREITNKQFAKVRNTFRSLRGAAPIGNSYEGKRQSGEAGDTLEMRQRQIYLIAAALGKHAKDAETCPHCQAKGGAIGFSYLIGIAAAKNRGHTLRDIDDLIKLPTSRLEQLLFTIRNRIAAREGKGDGGKPNKGQRKPKGGADE